MRVIRDSGYDQVRAVCGDHARLGEAGTRVVLLHGGMNAYNCDEETQCEIEGDEEPIKRAPWTREVTVQNSSQSNGSYVCYRG